MSEVFNLCVDSKERKTQLIVHGMPFLSHVFSIASAKYSVQRKISNYLVIFHIHSLLSQTKNK